MKTIAELYPARRRETNVRLIKGVRNAASREAFEAADAAVAGALHPSLIAELDTMEMTMPGESLEVGRRIVDGLFHQHLPALFRMRRAELEMGPEELLLEVAEGPEFYDYLLAEHPEAVDPPLAEALREALEAVQQQHAELISRVAAARRAEVAARVAGLIRSPHWLVELAAVEIWNSLARALDRLASRHRAKQFLRDTGGGLPRPGAGGMASPEAQVGYAGELRALAEAAGRFRLLELAALCEAIAEAATSVPADAAATFGGQRAVGFGPCERCSMSFASSSIVSFDPTCPGLIQGQSGEIHLPLEFNLAVCPFCGHQGRADAPAMFYSPQRNQVIYNLPTLDQYTEDEAVELHRPVIEDLRRGFMERVDEEGARAFGRATEELTYSVMEFMNAIHMGTTVAEEHVCNVVRLADGSGLLVDRTKGVLMSLTAAELSSRWASELGGIGQQPAPPADDEQLPTLRAAMRAFEARDFDRAREILAALVERNPADDVLRRNLAAVHFALGDRQAARELLGDS